MLRTLSLLALLAGCDNTDDPSPDDTDIDAGACPRPLAHLEVAPPRTATATDPAVAALATSV